MKQRSSELYPAWADAHLALKYINKGKARGCRASLWVRGESQRKLGSVGKWAGRRGGLVIFVGIVVLVCMCFGIQNIHLDTTLDSLWTPDSGRLLHELTYVSRVSGLSTDTNEMLIQTPKKSSAHSMLHSKALLEHLEVLQRALGVTVDLFDLNWSLKDLCYSANIQQLDVQFIDQIFEKVFPCIIITPLDCFWEGAKLLGPNVPITIPGFPGSMKWTNLNPQELLRRARLVPEANVQSFPFEIVEGFMKRAGIGSGYQEKPCLNPLDPECPITAPNKGSTAPPDIASILAGGCYGFASRFMHWAPDLIIGGPVHNKSGHVTKAGGLMSTVQLMSSSELFEFGRETWRLNHVEWSESKAQEVLTAWQTRFANEVSHLSMDEDRSSQFNFYTFTAAGLDSVVESASQFSWAWGGARVCGVVGITAIVGFLLSVDIQDWKVLLGLLLGGIFIALLGTTAGCGIAGFLKIPFNVASVQVWPYLTLSLVSQVFFILLYSQLRSGHDAKGTLKRHGFSLVLGIVSVAVFTGSGALFPIPAVRSMALQGAIFVGMSSLAIIVIYPAVCQLALKRRKPSTNNSCRSMNNPASKYPGNTRESANVDLSAQIVPFLSKSHKSCPNVKNNNVTLNNSNKTCSNNVVINVDSVRDNKIKTDKNFDEENQKCMKDGGESGNCGEDIPQKKRRNWVDVYLAFLNWRWFTGIVVVLYLAWFAFTVLGILRLRLGLPITDVVPSHSSEWEFLTAQGKLFPVYHMKAVTKANFDYPNNQKLLVKFHETMSSLPWVIRDDNGAVPHMWLSVFRDWLERLQAVFDREWKLGFLHKEGWSEQASADGILAFKLAVQTGHVDHPVDMTQLPGNRLIDSDGSINARAFYVYLTAWAWNDPLAYGATAANLKPEPRIWIHTPEDKELKIPKSAPIKYAEISYLLRTTRDDNEEQDKEYQILAFVQEVRRITTAFEARGLPVFPWGIPFRFYEQYLNLPMNSAIVIGVAGGMTAVVLFFSLGLKVRPVGVVVTIATITLAQIAGAIGWLGVGINALPVEIALLGVSLVIFSTIQLVVAFCCIPGEAATRRAIAFTVVGPPCVQSLVLISLAALILYSPEFTFIFTHFTLLISISAIIALLNLVLLAPVLLSIFKPSCWLIGTYGEDPALLHPLTPSPIPKRHNNTSKNQRSSSRSGSKSSRNYQPPLPSRNSRSYYNGGRGGGSRAPSENSLSTITEEPSSCATRRSAEIVVQPQVVVETFESENASKTKVSAKLKVEVHSTIHSSMPQSTTSTNASCNGSEHSGTSASTSSSGSFTSSSASSSTSSYDRGADD